MALTPASLLEAILFAAGEPLEKKRLMAMLEISQEMLDTALVQLRTELSGRGLALVETADEVELRTSAAAAPFVQKLRESELSRDLGKAGLEVLAIIVYSEQGATRSEIDWVRGVNSAAALRSLMLRGLVERREDQADKRRVRYTASIDALAHLGVGSRNELPRYAELHATLLEENQLAEMSTRAPSALESE